MSLLLDVLYAAHARSTHHKLALDALEHLTHPTREVWQTQFLTHHGRYLAGAKDPDDRFKDFRNHVLHVRQNNWGGATTAARKWYTQALEEFRRRDWSAGVYAAGVLSHYFTDPVQPFHTHQSDAENSIHRAFEWSTTKSYETLRNLLQQRLGYPEVDLNEGELWLEDLIERGAKLSNKFYESLIDHYDFYRGSKNPPAGFDEFCRISLARLIGWATIGFARVLDRLFEEASVIPPEQGLSLPTFLATVEIPIKWITNKIADTQERALIERMYAEYSQTGKVDRNLPADDRTIRDLVAQNASPQKTPAIKSSESPQKVRSVSDLKLAQQAPEMKRPETKPVTPEKPPVSRAMVPPVTLATVDKPEKQRPSMLRPPLVPAVEEPTLQPVVKPPLVVSIPVPLVKNEDSPAIDFPDLPEVKQKPEEPAAMAEPPSLSNKIEVADPAQSQVSAVPSEVREEPLVLSDAPAQQDPISEEAEKLEPQALVVPPSVAVPTVPVPKGLETTGEEERNQEAFELPEKVSAVAEQIVSPDAEQQESEPEEFAQADAEREDDPPLTHAEQELSPLSATESGGPAESGVTEKRLRYYLELDSEIVDAPSIGPKTAKRLKGVRVRRVRDLLASDPGELARQLKVAHITEQVIRDWQSESRLVCEILNLRGHDAQILVAVGIRESTVVATSDPVALSLRVQRFCKSPVGQRILRNGRIPEASEVTEWITNAQRGPGFQAA